MSSTLIPLIRATSLPKRARQIFVAYPYQLYPKHDYRQVFETLAESWEVRFIFADEQITTLHVLQKISDFIRESQFSIFDISGWNPNVTLELGLAYGYGEKAYIAINPSKPEIEEVPADLRGIDRIQYSSYKELNEKVSLVLEQELQSKSSQRSNLAGVVYDYILRHDGVISLGRASKELGLRSSELKELVEQLKKEGRLA